MKKALAVALLGAVFAGFAMAQPYSIELDLDGIQGNGPDVLAAEVSDYIAVDIWINGAGLPLISSNLTLCNHDGSLEFQGYVDNIKPNYATWVITDPVIIGNCVLLQATDFCGALPRMATALFIGTSRASRAQA